MTDEEALGAYRHEWACRCRDLGSKFPSVNEADAYAAGFRAGLKHARAWRPLTEDPATWPAEGQLVAAKRGDMGALLRREGSMLRGLSTSLALAAAGGIEMSGCPICGAQEVEADTPRTTYACGSSDYDQRPGTFDQKCSGGCPRHQGGDRSCIDVRCQRTWKPDGAPTCEEQLQRWVNGDSVCPNEDHECCPDFSCCRPQLRWPEEKRRAFTAADQGTREKMLMGALGALVDDVGVSAHITRGEPVDHEGS